MCARACRWIILMRFNCTEGCGNVDINVRTSSACKSCLNMAMLIIMRSLGRGVSKEEADVGTQSSLSIAVAHLYMSPWTSATAMVPTM